MKHAVLAAGLAAAVAPLVATGAVVPGDAGAATGSWAATATQAVPAPAGATTLGPLAGTTPISVTVGLALRNTSALDAFLAQADTPSSPNGGAAYTPASFTATFGPTASSVGAVTGYLQQQGFTNVTASPNNLLISADGTAAQVSQAFHTTLTRYSLDGAALYANATGAMVPTNLSGIVVGVLGLNDVFRAAPSPVASGRQTTPPSLPTLPNVTDEYTPQGFQKAYDVTGTPTGSKTAIATVAAGLLTAPIADLRTEEQAVGLPQVPVTVEASGITGVNTATDNVEWDLDSQFATGMAQDVSHFYFYDATTLADSTLARTFNLFATQDRAKALGASLGECEVEAYLDGSMLVDDEVFAEAAAQGQTVFASSGDTGAGCALEGTNGVPDSGPPMANYPASSPYVVGVGGTTLTTKATGSYDAETSWVAGGGGLSQFEERPAWQATVMPLTDGKTGDRGVPDIAMDANPTTGAEVTTTTGPEGVGGTSLSAPLALGAWARIESGYHNRLGFASPALYAVYLHGTCNATAVEDVCTTPAFHAPLAGDNGLYPETPGYNYDTGLGTLDTAALLAALKPFVPAATHMK